MRLKVEKIIIFVCCAIIYEGLLSLIVRK